MVVRPAASEDLSKGEIDERLDGEEVGCCVVIRGTH